MTLFYTGNDCFSFKGGLAGTVANCGEITSGRPGFDTAISSAAVAFAGNSALRDVDVENAADTDVFFDANSEHALTALAALLFSRGLLELAIGVDRDVAFFVVLRKVSDPLLALVSPITPGFLVPFAASLYAAFLFFFLKLFLFGDGFLGVPPLFILLYLVLMTAF